MKKRTDIQQQITDTFLARLNDVEAGKWEKPFFGTGTCPVNVTSKKAYRGINVLVLMMAGFSSDVWGTYKQWAEKGAQVKGGQKSTQIVLWKPTEYKDKATGEKKNGMYIAHYNVFNADQVEGYDAPVVDLVDITERHAAADEFFAACGITTSHTSQGRACYIPSVDRVEMPGREYFKATSTSSATDAYYSTLAHEYVHATLHANRLDRNMGSYALEELVAEIGAAMVMAHLGLNNTVREDHIKYVKSWLKELTDDKKAVVTAGSKAQKALDWMVDQQDEEALAQAA